MVWSIPASSLAERACAFVCCAWCGHTHKPTCSFALCQLWLLVAGLFVSFLQGATVRRCFPTLPCVMDMGTCSASEDGLSARISAVQPCRDSHDTRTHAHSINNSKQCCVYVAGNVIGAAVRAGKREAMHLCGSKASFARKPHSSTGPEVAQPHQSNQPPS